MTLTLGHDTVSVRCRLRGHRFETQQYEDAHASFTVCARCGAVPTQPIPRLDMQAAVLAVYQDDEPATAEPAPETVEAAPDAVEAVTEEPEMLTEEPATEHSPAEAADLADTTDPTDLVELHDQPAVEVAEAPQPQVAAAAMAAEPADGRRIDLYTRLPETRLDELAGRARELRERWSRSRSKRIVT